MTDNEIEQFLEYVIELGKRMLECGAEVQRAEDMMQRICTSYGFSACQVYATTPQILVTIKNSNGTHFTQSARVTYTSNNLGMLENINAKSRKICKELPQVEEIKTYLDEPLKKPNKLLEMLGFVIPAGAFTIFFGGSLMDGIVSAFLAIIVFAMDKLIRLKRMSRIIYTIFACFITGMLSQFLCKIGIGNNANSIMIGLIMLFIPTLALVNGVREIFHRDIITGIFRMIEALMITVSIAMGFAASIMIMGGKAI